MGVTNFENLKQTLIDNPKTWLVTGVAGFIGSNLLEALLKLNQFVVGIDNFSTGYKHNLIKVNELVGVNLWENFKFINGDIRNPDDCALACQDVDYVLHQAALGSVPRSIKDPLTTNSNNIDGFLNLLIAARDANCRNGVRNFVYASSSSTYGDHLGLPKIESQIGRPLSPYAVTKYVNELYANVFAQCYGMKSIGLRYFNVFGPRQDPNGSYAAVIPKWLDLLIRGEEIVINGDGSTSRDFCYVQNVVQANLMAATVENKAAFNQVFNVAVGGRTTLNELFFALTRELKLHNFVTKSSPIYSEFRCGDIAHSQACISKIENILGYSPTHNMKDGLKELVEYYINNYKL